MKKWTIGSAALFLFCAGLAFFLYQPGSLWWLVLGCVMGGALSLTLLSSQEAANDPAELQKYKDRISALEQHLGAAESKLLQQQEEWGKERERVQKKLQEASEKCDAYKRLADVQQAESERLREEAVRRSESLLAKGRRLAELELYLEDPKIFPQEGEFLFDQLKQQVEEKTQALELARAEKFLVETKLIALQKQVEAQMHDDSGHAESLQRDLKTVQEEKDILQTELFSIQELVSEISEKKKEAHDEALTAAALARQLEEKTEESKRLQEELAKYTVKKKKTPAQPSKKGRKKSDPQSLGF